MVNNIPPLRFVIKCLVDQQIFAILLNAFDEKVECDLSIRVECHPQLGTRSSVPDGLCKRVYVPPSAPFGKTRCNRES